MSPQTRLAQNFSEDVSGLPTYEEARVLRMKEANNEESSFDAIG